MIRAEVNFLRAIRGPVTLILVGVLFAMDHFTRWSFNQTWPLLLIVFGLLSLGSRRMVPPAPPPGAPASPAAPIAPGGAQ